MFCARCGAKVTALLTRPRGHGGFYCDACSQQATLDREPPASRRERSRLPLALALLTIAGACVAAAAFAVRSTGAVPPPAEQATAPVPATPRLIGGPAGHAEPAPGDRAVAGHDPVVNSVGMVLVRVGPGGFDMGSPDGESGRKPDELLRPVRITTPFYVGATEVTQAQWKAVMGRSDNPSLFRGDDLPVERVSWGAAVDYCERLGRREGARYRLPTEAEWEYACRSGTATPYATGDRVGPGDANVKGDGASGGPGRTLPAGSLRPNAWGLLDAHGNVWDWCADRYGPYPPGPATNPQGPEHGDRRVVRGGSRLHGPANARSASRYAVDADSRVPDFGFRVVREVGPVGSPTPDATLADDGGTTLRASATHSFTFDESTLDWSASPPRAHDAGAGRPPAVVVGATAAADGRSGAALAFGSPGRRVEVLDSPADGSGGGLTLAAWVRLDRGGSGSVIDRADWAGGPTRGYVLRMIDGRVDFTIGGEDTWHTVATDRPLPVGRWVHLTATYDGRVGVVYVDGRPAAAGTLPRLVPSRQPLCIGCGSFEIARERVFPGALDEVGVFDRALTAGEVRMLVGSR